MGVVSEAEIFNCYQQALEFSSRSRALILEKARLGFAISRKSDTTEVTEADREAELVLRESIRAAFPQHGIIGEEFPSTNEGAELQWVLDPIDGTSNFARGIPTFGTIIGVFFRGVPIVGIIDHPALALRYSAFRGGGTFCNGKRITLSDSPSSPADELVAMSAGSNYGSAAERECFCTLVKRLPHIRVYGDCYSQSSAVCGSVSAYFGYNLNRWDFAATQILTEEAGGAFFEHPLPLARSLVICGRKSAVAGVRRVVAEIFGLAA